MSRPGEQSGYDYLATSEFTRLPDLGIIHRDDVAAIFQRLLLSTEIKGDLEFIRKKNLEQYDFRVTTPDDADRRWRRPDEPCYSTWLTDDTKWKGCVTMQHVRGINTESSVDDLFQTDMFRSSAIAIFKPCPPEHGSRGISATLRLEQIAAILFDPTDSDSTLEALLIYDNVTHYFNDGRSPLLLFRCPESTKAKYKFPTGRGSAFALTSIDKLLLHPAVAEAIKNRKAFAEHHLSRRPHSHAHHDRPYRDPHPGPGFLPPPQQPYDRYPPAGRELYELRELLDRWTAAYHQLDAAHRQLGAEHGQLDAAHRQLGAEHGQLDAAHRQLNAMHRQLEAEHGRLLDENKVLRRQIADSDRTIERLEAELQFADTELHHLNSSRTGPGVFDSGPREHSKRSRHHPYGDRPGRSSSSRR